jgi:hypothetical protein
MATSQRSITAGTRTTNQSVWVKALEPLPTRGDSVGTTRKGLAGADMVYWTGCAPPLIEIARG